ncbi:MAG: class I SAM-dependent methyltransferase [Desulfopila sp.]|nr:class I SAM-dependent methyltransferase [Desulfopila sp.]
MSEKKFDPKKLQKLNNPARLADIPPDYIWEKLDMDKPDVLVEIGAGTAFFSIAFLHKTQCSKIYACDMSDIMIDWMLENVSPQYPGIIPVKTAEYSVPLENAIADLLFMINLHHELENPALTLTEAARLLKPEGKICIIDWKNREMPEGPPLEIRCVPEQVQEQLGSTGFQQLQIFDELPKHFLITGHKR